ncbi:MAG: efflux RND transporter permease subunit, partial [Myxococcota bacterium]
MSPSRFSVQQRVLVNLGFLMVLLAGVMVSRGIPVDVFPDISFNSVVILTPWPGASADEMERLVTRKIEEEIQDVNGIKEWSSFSSENASEINIEWQEELSESEQQNALNELRAAIDRVADLPEDVEESLLREMSVSEVSNVCMVALSDLGGVSEFTLRELARALERKIERLKGVRKGTLMGARDREIRVYVDRNRALQFDLTLDEISRLIASNNLDLPGGSFSTDSDQEITLRGLGSFVSPEELAETVIRKNSDGNHVTLAEIAEVVSDFEKRTSFGYLNGRPTILVGVSKTPDADVGELVARVRELALQEAGNLPDGVALEVIWDESIFVNKRITTLRNNLALGIALVVLVLWLTLGFRNSLLAMIGIPFSFLMALVLFPVLGLTINMLSLVGFVMVSGMLVDDAIIVIENIYRHVESGKKLKEAAIQGTQEVMWPVIGACTTTMAAFAPMLLVTGTAGQFMSILPKTVIACLLGSIVESLFVLPAHYVEWGSRSKNSTKSDASRNFVARKSQALRTRIDGFVDLSRAAYGRAVARILEHRGAFLLASVGLLILALGLATRVRIDLFPSDFNQLFVSVETPVDFTIEESNQVILGLESALEPLEEDFLSVST